MSEHKHEKAEAKHAEAHPHAKHKAAAPPPPETEKVKVVLDGKEVEVDVDSRLKWSPREIKALSDKFAACADDKDATQRLYDEVRVANPFNTEVHDLIHKLREAAGCSN